MPSLLTWRTSLMLRLRSLSKYLRTVRSSSARSPSAATKPMVSMPRMSWSSLRAIRPESTSSMPSARLSLTSLAEPRSSMTMRGRPSGLRWTKKLPGWGSAWKKRSMKICL
jgi:hypothetical protein